MKPETEAFYAAPAPLAAVPSDTPLTAPAIIRIDSTGPQQRQKRVPLFYIDDRQYSIPEEVTAREAHQAMVMIADQGTTAASVWMMRQALGADGYRDLLACPQVDDPQMRHIEKVITELFLSAIRALGKD